MDTALPVIPPESRSLALLTHLSGLAGYVIPLGGVLVPIVIWVAKSDDRVISAIARQAVLLNFCIFAAIAVTAVLFITVILIPVVLLLWGLLGLAAVILPIVGAVRASEGTYYRYPVVGSLP